MPSPLTYRYNPNYANDDNRKYPSPTYPNPQSTNSNYANPHPPSPNYPDPSYPYLEAPNPTPSNPPLPNPPPSNPDQLYQTLVMRPRVPKKSLCGDCNETLMIALAALIIIGLVAAVCIPFVVSSAVIINARNQ